MGDDNVRDCDSATIGEEASKFSVGTVGEFIVTSVVKGTASIVACFEIFDPDVATNE
jgi:hypothetical protein